MTQWQNAQNEKSGQIFGSVRFFLCRRKNYRTFSQNCIRICATWARVATPWGASVRSPMPEAT